MCIERERERERHEESAMSHVDFIGSFSDLIQVDFALGGMIGTSRLQFGQYRVAVKELKLSYHNPETILFTIYPYCGSLNQVP